MLQLNHMNRPGHTGRSGASWRVLAAALPAVVILSVLPGCGGTRASRVARTWYIDGAGNWGFGAVDVPRGLEDAGYQGDVQNFRWSVTLNPALDQTLRFIARASGQRLAGEIRSYLKRNPGADVNIIALSAGTGVGMWAAEDLKPPYKIDNMILLGSSLSSKYNVAPALKNMKGRIFVYHAKSDPVLNGPVRLLGTIDGNFDDAAGLVGLRATGPAAERVVNIPWQSKYVRYGWTGGHTDCTNRRFVSAFISHHVVREYAPAVAPEMDGSTVARLAE